MTQPDDPPVDLDNLAEFAPQLAAALAAIASDVALVIDADGIICNVATGGNALDSTPARWVGQPWADTVTGETRKKVEQLLLEAKTNGVSQRREVNHPSPSGSDIPMTYAAIRLGESGSVLVAGRDLRAISAIQQRFLQTQQEMERSYWVQRQSEARYRMLFQAATDAVLVVNSEALLVVDANPAASQMFGLTRGELLGANPAQHLELRSRRSVEEMLVTARGTGKPAELRAHLQGEGVPIVVSATPFRGQDEMLLLVRVSAVDLGPRSTDASFKISGAVEKMHDAVVITDSSGRLLMTNPAFLQLCGVANEAQIKGRLINEWVGQEEELGQLLSTIRQRGLAGRVATSVRAMGGSTVPVELSAAILTDGEQEHIGITLHPIRDSGGLAPLASDTLLHAFRKITLELGHLPLNDLLREVIQVAEREFVHAAMLKTQGNETDAAALLGISLENYTARLIEHGLKPRAADSGSETPVLH